ncbi:hypothetical protein LXL04_011568 [Taraxacum kok-saghyz]
MEISDPGSSSVPGNSAHTVALEFDLNETPLPSSGEEAAGGNGDGSTADHRCCSCCEAKGKVVVCCECAKHFQVECFRGRLGGRERTCSECLMECSSGKRLRRTVSATSGGDLGLMDMNVSPPREVEGDDVGVWVNSESAFTNSAPKMQDTYCNNLFTEFTLTSCNNTSTHHPQHVTNGFPSTTIETNDNSLISLQNGSQSHAIKTMEPTSKSLKVSNGGNAVKVDSMENGNHGFPVQFEDFFVISVGKVNPRRSFHTSHQIWPIGYKSIWHDKITASIFVCNVLEGDDYGPIFRVNRHPCSKQSLPNASTVIHNPNCGPPSDENTSSCLTLTTESQHTPSDNNNNFVNGDVIGEFMVEGRSTSSAWNMVLETLISACRHAFKDLSVVSFHCNHNNEEQFYGSYGVDSLDKFGCLTLTGQPVDPIRDLILTKEQLEVSCTAIKRWLEMDRFGLDAEFVQELIEQQLSGVGDCSEYKSLDARCQDSIARTVRSGFFTVLHKYNTLDNLAESRKRLGPPGNTVASNLPPCLIGDVLQAYEFWLRFHKVLGQDAPLSRQILEKELLDPWVNGFNFNPPNSDKVQDLTSCSRIAPGTTATMLPNFHMSMLKVLVEDMLAKVTIYDPPFGSMESKSRKGSRKKLNMDISNITVSSKKGSSGIFPINAITWPEVARRYILVLLSMDDNYEAPDLTNREFDQVFHCLNGDGGPLCGSLTGMAAIEADAMILAEASKRIFSCVKSSNIGDLIIDNKDVDMNECVREKKVIIDNKCPEWIKVLEPIRRQPTNVGARIRNRVFKSLEKDPPEWAKEMLLRSISKDVYKGNASGPTKVSTLPYCKKTLKKKIVVSVLDKVRDETPLTKKKVKESRVVRTVSDVIIKRCRMVLRAVAVAEDVENNKAFFGFMKPNEFDDLVTLSRRLDFRTIDLRLDAGFYDDSHQSFIEDVREVWENLRKIYRNRPKYMDSIETISRKLEELYKQEVVALMEKSMDYGNEETKKELNMMMIETITATLFIAPWEDGICKVCGKDENDHILLLCDRCDAEYHTYCLDPPLQRVPKASWYCPPCISFITSQSQSQTMSREYYHGPTKKKSQREFTRIGLEELADLADVMESMEYWELGVKERVFLLQLLCDESLSSTLIQNHMTEESFNFHKNFLGRDSDGRLYWALGRPERVFMTGPHTIGETSSSSSSSSSWVCYESDCEIVALIEWLEDDDAKEKELKENIKKWQTNNRLNDVNDHHRGEVEVDGLMASGLHGTNARAELEKKFGEIIRCDCLEIVGPTPTGHHCFTCHSTFSSVHQCEVEGIIGKKVDEGITGNKHTSYVPLVGKAYEVLQFLKIILMDIEAALPNEAFRPSRKDPNRLPVWRAFLKSAKSIYEMVEASITLEDMIKTDYLRKEWRYWSSPSAAAKISTLSALALQIYALDAAIYYHKPPPVDPPESATTFGSWNLESKDETPVKPNRNSSMELVMPGNWDLEPKEETPKKSSKLKEKRKSSSSTMELVMPGNWDSESKAETPKKSKLKENRKTISSTMELMPGNWDYESKSETPKKSNLKEKRKSSSSTMELVMPGNWDSESKAKTPKKSKRKENRKTISSTMELMPGNWDSESKSETPKKSKLKEKRKSSSSTMELVMPGNWDSESKEETPKKSSKLKENRKSSSSTMELMPGNWDSESKAETPKKSKLKEKRKSSNSTMDLVMPGNWDSKPKEETPEKSSNLKENQKSSSPTMELVIPVNSESKEETPKKSKLMEKWKSSSSSSMVGMLNDSEPKSKTRKELDVFDFSD